MDHDSGIPQDELMAYLDGELDAERTQFIEALMQQDKALLATVVALQTQQQRLRAALDPVLDEPVPLRLLQIGKSPRYPQRIAASVLWLTVGLVTGALSSGYYVAHRNGDTPAQTARAADLPNFARQASVAYAVFAPEVRHPVEVESIDAKGLNAWLSKRLQRPVQAPDLSQSGFSLMGGRLLPAETNRPAAQFMYENRAGQRITVYLRGMAEPTAETAFRFAQHGLVNTFYWVEDEWGYALSGEMSRNQLLQLAQVIHGYLSRKPANRVSALTPL